MCLLKLILGFLKTITGLVNYKLVIVKYVLTFVLSCQFPDVFRNISCVTAEKG